MNLRAISGRDDGCQVSLNERYGRIAGMIMDGSRREKGEAQDNKEMAEIRTAKS